MLVCDYFPAKTQNSHYLMIVFTLLRETEQVFFPIVVTIVGSVLHCTRTQVIELDSTRFLKYQESFQSLSYCDFLSNHLQLLLAHLALQREAIMFACEKSFMLYCENEICCNIF